MLLKLHRVEKMGMNKLYTFSFKVKEIAEYHINLGEIGEVERKSVVFLDFFLFHWVDKALNQCLGEIVVIKSLFGRNWSLKTVCPARI